MLTKPHAVLLTAVLVAGLGTGAAEAATKVKAKPRKLVASQTTLYMNGNAPAGKCTESPSLSTKPDDSGSEGCGIEGLPAEEVLYTLNGGPTYTDYTTTAKDGMPLIVDASRKITGQVGTSSWTGLVGGLGEVDVDLEVAATTTTGKTVIISNQVLKATVTPAGKDVENLAWSAPIPASLKGTTLKGFRVSVDIHGKFVNQGAKHYKGDSFVVIPSFK